MTTVWLCAKFGGTMHSPPPIPTEHPTEAAALAHADTLGAALCVVYPIEVEETPVANDRLPCDCSSGPHGGYTCQGFRT